MIYSHHSIFSIISETIYSCSYSPMQGKIFFLGKGRPAAVPFPASSSLTSNHFLSTGSLLGSMAASSASAVCLELKEVLGWFSDPNQKEDVFAKFIQAKSATRRHPDAWARENWLDACQNMRDVMEMEADLSGKAFNMVCTLLEQHSKELKENLSNRQPGNHQPGGAKARSQCGSAALGLARRGFAAGGCYSDSSARYLSSGGSCFKEKGRSC